MNLSVVIISKNESRNIDACLKSVSFADEIIVVDSGSDDGTVEQARALGAHVIVTSDWPGFGAQKSRALAAARGKWILSIDADERVTEKLKREILEAIEPSKSYAAYYLPRLTNFCGEWIEHSGWYPDLHIRLFLKDSARFSNDLVHESVVVERGGVGHLKAPIIHYSFRSQNDFLRKLVQYSTLGADQSLAMGRHSSLTKAIAFALIDFVRRYFGYLGFLDGRAGFIIAVLSAEQMFHKYLGLSLLRSPIYLQTLKGGDPAPPAKYAE